MSKVKNRWPLAIALIYAVFVVVLITFVIFSQYNTVDLVSEDYYRQEIAYQQQINRITRTSALPRSITWQYEQPYQRIHIAFPLSFEASKTRGRIHLFRPSDASIDRQFPLRLSAAGKQVININLLKTGLWRIKIYWQYENKEYYDEGIFEKINNDI